MQTTHDGLDMVDEHITRCEFAVRFAKAHIPQLKGARRTQAVREACVAAAQLKYWRWAAEQKHYTWTLRENEPHMMRQVADTARLCGLNFV